MNATQPASTTPTPLLEVRDLRVSIGGRELVHGLSFQLMRGETLALVGESGSGKTLSALSLLKLLPQAEVSGRALLAVRESDPQSPPRDLLALNEKQLQAVRGQDVSVVFQEPMTALNPLMTVGAQIAEVLLTKKGLGAAASAAQAVALLEQTGVREAARRARHYPHQLSGGQRQRAMIAMALASEPQLLIADEPTTALDVTLRVQILGKLQQMAQERGTAVLLITHDLHLVRSFARHVAVMENGHIVEQGATGDVFTNPQHAYTRKLLDSTPRRNVVEAAGTPTPAVLSARAARVVYTSRATGLRGWFKRDEHVAVQAASFELQRGRTLCVVGESGSGKSSLALAVLGLIPAGGDLLVQGRAWQTKGWHTTRANRPLRRAVQVVFQDPFASLSPRMTVEQIVTEGLRVHHPQLGGDERRARALDTLREVGLTLEQFPSLLERYPHEFSGGQRQRLAIARALIIEPEVVVLDEPTSALDVTIQQQVLGLLQRLQRDKGLAYLLITHDMDVVRAMAHDVLVLKNGDVVEQGPLEQLLAAPRDPYTRTLLEASLAPQRSFALGEGADARPPAGGYSPAASAKA